MGAATHRDFPIKAGNPPPDELCVCVSVSHPTGQDRTGLDWTGLAPTGTAARHTVWTKNKKTKSLHLASSTGGNLQSMVLTDAPTRMSRTDEVHRITENVYKVRRTEANSRAGRSGPDRGLSAVSIRPRCVLRRGDTCCCAGDTEDTQRASLTQVTRDSEPSLGRRGGGHRGGEEEGGGGCCCRVLFILLLLLLINMDQM